MEKRSIWLSLKIYSRLIRPVQAHRDLCHLWDPGPAAILSDGFIADGLVQFPKDAAQLEGQSLHTGHQFVGDLPVMLCMAGLRLFPVNS